MNLFHIFSDSNLTYCFEIIFLWEQATKKKDPLTESVFNMTKSISEFVTQRRADEPLKFLYIWQNLDRLFQKISTEDVDALNVKFINMAYEKINKE